MLHWLVQEDICRSRRYLSTSAILILTDKLFWCSSVIRAVNGTFCIMEFSLTLKKLKARVIFSKFFHCWIKKAGFLFFIYLFIFWHNALNDRTAAQYLNVWPEYLSNRRREEYHSARHMSEIQSTSFKAIKVLSKPPKTELTCTWEENNAKSSWLGGGGTKTLHSAIECVVECWLKRHLDASSIFQKPNFVCLGQRRLVAAAKDAPATQPTCVTHVAAERLSVEQQTVSR